MPFVLIDHDCRPLRPLRVFTDLIAADDASRPLPGALVACVPTLPDGSPNLAHLNHLQQCSALWEEVGKL